MITAKFPDISVTRATTRWVLRVVSEGSRIIARSPDLRELFMLSALPD